MSFSCTKHGWSHLLNACPFCLQYSMSGDATDISEVAFTKEQALNPAVETWKAREACWNREREQLRSKLSAAEKERDELKAKLALAVSALELIGFRASASIINAEEEWSMSANWVERLCTKALKAINGGE